MARYRGPKSKIARRFNEAIFGPDKALDKKPYGPGMHGNTRRRGKKSEYAIQLAEKQKAKYTYGVLERQFAKTFALAVTKRGVTGENLLNIPSYLLKAGDVISVREKSKSLENINISLAKRKSHNWLQWDATNFQGTFLALPEREDIPEKIKEQLIVELYSK